MVVDERVERSVRVGGRLAGGHNYRPLSHEGAQEQQAAGRSPEGDKRDRDPAHRVPYEDNFIVPVERADHDVCVIGEPGLPVFAREIHSDCRMPCGPKLENQ